MNRENPENPFQLERRRIGRRFSAASSRYDRAARLQTVVSLGLWIAVIICGRWIAYR